MKTIHSMLGMPVIRGRKVLGRVIEVELSEDLRRMNGLWIDAGFRGMRRFSAEGLSLIGDVAIGTDENGKRGKCAKKPLLLRAVSTDGRRIGAIVGAEVDEMTFTVTALILSRGYVEDFTVGQERVERFCVGKGAVVLPADGISNRGGEEKCAGE